MKRALLAALALGVVAVIVLLSVFSLGAAPSPGLLTSVSQDTGCTSDQRLAAPVSADLGGDTLTDNQVERYLYAAGFRGGDIVTGDAIAHAESGMNPTVTNHNTNGSTDYGLMEINSVHQDLLAGGDWSDPGDNTHMAFEVFTQAGNTWGPWSTYESGSYKQFLPQAQAASSQLGIVATSLGCSASVISGTGVSDPGLGQQGPDGLTPRAENVKATVVADWGCNKHPAPCIATIGGYEPRTIAGTNVLSDHATGNAIDAMLPVDYKSAAAQALGVQIAEFWEQNAKAAGIKYIIFNRHIWDVNEHDPLVPWAQWRPYSHPGGLNDDTDAHVNHVHISVLS